MNNALAGADLYCIVDACSVDGWVFVEKVKESNKATIVERFKASKWVP